MTPSDALLHLLRPLARFALASGLRFQEMERLLKTACLQAAERDFALEGRPPTASRLSLVTGLQRKDIRAREAGAAESAPRPHPLARLVAAWPAGRDHLDRAEFEGLAAEVSQDLHPRTLLDEMLRLGLAERSGDGLRLLTRALVAPAEAGVMRAYLARNAGDHAAAAVANVLAAPAPGGFLDRAAHYGGLSPASIAELDALARAEAEAALARVSRRAAELQAADAAAGRMRFRFGAYTYAEDETR